MLYIPLRHVKLSLIGKFSSKCLYHNSLYFIFLVKVLSGEDLLKSKLLKEHMGDKFVVLAIKDKSPQVLSNDDT